MRKFFFSKLSGAGNDFVLFDTKSNPELTISTSDIIKLCDRRSGIGADGVLLIDESDIADYKLSYFNSDGSFGSLCANGSRCSLWYFFFKYQSDKKLKFLFQGNIYTGEILGEENVKFYLKDVELNNFNIQINAANQLIEASFLDTGSPHVVINAKNLKSCLQDGSFYNDIGELDVNFIGSEIRYLKDFSPSGTNVNFIQIDNELIKIRTYERGVENETLSCGTGSVASAITAFLNYNLIPPIKLKAKSGDFLIVDFNFTDKRIRNISLSGPAKIIFNGEITI